MAAVTIHAMDDYPLIEPEPDGSLEVPGVGRISADLVAGQVRWLGRSGEDGPWVYVNYFPRGHVVPFHFHDANRSELLIRGAILWHEQGKESIRYEAPSFSYVEARNTYGFEVLEDAEIVVQFDGPPMLNLESNRRREL
jgi:hypothetical protein